MLTFSENVTCKYVNIMVFNLYFVILRKIYGPTLDSDGTWRINQMKN